MVDSQYAAGEIGVADWDWVYRTRLARVGSFGVWRMEVRSRLVDLGRLLPEESM